MARTASLPLVLLVLALPIAWALPTPLVLDDAGSGQDAGGTLATAMPLGYGSYSGNMTSGDADWFVFPSGPPLGCMKADFSTSHAMRVGFGAGSASAIGGLTDGAFGTTLAIPALPPALAALPDEAPWDAVSVGPYEFSLQVSAPALVGDSNLADAASQIAGAQPAPGDCFRGHFRSDGSDVDVYSFTVGPSERATYTIAQSGGAGASAFVLDTTGALLGAPVSPGEIGEVALPQSGVYYVAATSEPSTMSSTYALALVAGPDPAGCRPLCLSDVS